MSQRTRLIANLVAIEIWSNDTVKLSGPIRESSRAATVLILSDPVVSASNGTIRKYRKRALSLRGTRSQDHLFHRSQGVSKFLKFVRWRNTCATNCADSLADYARIMQSPTRPRNRIRDNRVQCRLRFRLCPSLNPELRKPTWLTPTHGNPLI